MHRRPWRERRGLRLASGLLALATLGLSIVRLYSYSDVTITLVLTVLFVIGAFPSLVTPCMIGALVCAIAARANGWDRASIIPGVLLVGFLTAAYALRRRRVRSTDL